MNGPYIILHKVRGEPQFDIAIPLQIGNEDGWILPTCGYRCYPAKAWKLAELNIPPFEEYISRQNWDDLPDIFSVNEISSNTSVESILALLGVKKPTIRRRL